MTTFFYIPEHHLPDKERRASWESGRPPSLLGSGKSASAQAWLFQTWIEVRHQTDAMLSTTLPEEGSIVTLSSFLPQNFRASGKQFIAAVAADFLPHAGAQVQILQNAAHAKSYPGAVFIPHWPQPNLIPRDPERGDRFETLAYFGDAQNLATELLTACFLEKLKARCGMRLEVRPPHRWHDYSDVDAVLAIRDFSRARHLHKPATKLYNTWIAGVPLITGRESACEAEGRVGGDYLRADSPESLLKLLERLRSEPGLLRQIVSEGHKKTASRNRNAVRDLWRNLLECEIPRRREAWNQLGNTGRTMFWLSQRLIAFLDRKIRS